MNQDQNIESLLLLDFLALQGDLLSFALAVLDREDYEEKYFDHSTVGSSNAFKIAGSGIFLTLLMTLARVEISDMKFAAQSNSLPTKCRQRPEILSRIAVFVLHRYATLEVRNAPFRGLKATAKVDVRYANDRSFHYSSLQKRFELSIRWLDCRVRFTSGT